MIKKTFISIAFLFSFFLIFLFGFDTINVFAYSDVGNALGSYPVKLDIDNYNRENLYDNIYTECGYSYITNCSLRDNNVYVDVDAISPNGYTIITKNIRSLLETDQEYTFSIFTENDNDYFWFRLFDSNNTDYIGAQSYNKSITYTFTDNRPLYLAVYTSDETPSYIINGIMITKGNERPASYSSIFKFGYNVHYSVAVNNLTSNQINAGIAITDINGNYLKTGNCIIPASSSTICYNINEPLYLPFDIDNNGYVSFNYSLGLFIDSSSSLSVIANDSGLFFTPVFNAYYKGAFTSNLYFKDKYTFNNLFLNGYNVSVNSSTPSKIFFGSTQFDDNYLMNSNNSVNFATDKNIPTGSYNYINYNSYLSSFPNNIYSFAVTTGVSSPDLFKNRIYTISFSNLSLKVKGDISNVSPLPINPNTINKYNVCSAWYDLPCQIGNGITYVIYEAPIISPILTFIFTFITMFSSLVSFVDLFKSFGIVFGCFIIYMFIELLHKYSK